MKSLYTLLICLSILFFACVNRRCNLKIARPKCGVTVLSGQVTKMFYFQKVYQENYNKFFLIDTLFKDFNVAEGKINVNKSKNAQYEFLEFTKGYNSDINESFMTYKENKFTFYKGRNGKYALALAEINFNSSLAFTAETSNLFKVIVADSVLIDQGTTKNSIEKTFKINKLLCDTVVINDELQALWLYFKDNKIDKIIPQIYLHK